MKFLPRILLFGAALALLAVSCAAPTGEAPPAATTPVTTAPAAPTPVAVNHLILIGDTVRGQAGLTDEEKKLDNWQGLHCVVMSRFPQGSRIVWRMKVLDALTGQSLGDKQLEYVRITYPDGKTEALKYGGHGGTKENPADFFWAVGFTVPNDYPTGVFNYKIGAKSLEGKIGRYGYDAFKVSFAQLQIVPASEDKRRF